MAKKKKAKVPKVSDVDFLLDLPLTEPQKTASGTIADESTRPILSRHLSPEEFKLYSTLEDDIEVESEGKMDEIIEKLQEVHIQDPDLQVHSEAEIDREHLIQNELRYLCTILSPEERRTLCFEVYYSLLNDESVSHLDLSDMITDSLKPTLARTALVKADAEHKYSTAQYMQVYNCLRLAQLQYSLVFGQAMLDGLKAGADSIYWSGGKFEK